MRTIHHLSYEFSFFRSLNSFTFIQGGTVLHASIEQRQWKSVLSRMQHCPHEISTYVYRIAADTKDAHYQYNVLPLHSACMRKPPALVVSALLSAFPEAAIIKCDGDLALHFALRCGASLDVIQTLILAHPKCLKEQDDKGNSCLQIFESHQQNWEDEIERSSIWNVVKQGVDSIVLEKTSSSASHDKKVDSEKKNPHDMMTTINEEGWKKAGLSVVVVGASGDLAKKKTYPSLLHLFDDNLLPDETVIYGYARSNMTNEDLRAKLRPYLENSDCSKEVVDTFLSKCFYVKGGWYGDIDAFATLNQELIANEDRLSNKLEHNRLFYFAIPPNVFEETGVAIKQKCMSEKGWTRIIVEKPFGRDLQSCEELLATLSKHFSEDQLFRIDHYLGKEMVQNLLVLRFGNIMFENIWNRDNVQCVMLTFKEPFGTDGRGGYFDNYGIIRDIVQNHLLQVLTLLAMEPPTKADGPESGESIRNAKVNVLHAIPPITLDECFLGQYEGYTDDETIKNKDSNTPTFVVIRCFIHTPRWAGVPFILKAGKALNERKAEMRIQFKDAPAASFMFDDKCPRNELVIRMQPNEAIYWKTNVKSPGFSGAPVQSELEVNYNTRFFNNSGQNDVNPDAYTRLILEVLRGRSAAFVREDELRRSWAIFTPLLHKIENEKIKPIIYKRGTRGPPQADDFIREKSGYVRNEDYKFFSDSIESKTPKKQGKATADIGVYGLSVMGQNFALNIASHGFEVCVGNRSPQKVDSTVRRAEAEGKLPITGAFSPEDFIRKLKRPRKVILLVQAGNPVDASIKKLSKFMDKGDIIVDGGNEWYPNSVRRAEGLLSKGIHFAGMGISGGEEGAREGPSLMFGGPKLAFSELETILTSCAAQSKWGPCFGYCGPIGSGNYVKMVHNGIEYGDMQLIAEVYDVMKHVLELSNVEMSKIFASWNQGRLESYLIEITASILAREDDITHKGQVVDYILDKTGSKGTGKWTVQEAAEVSVAAPTISGALDTRYLSSRKDERVAASKILEGPPITLNGSKANLIQDLEKALYAAKICSYAQGLSIIKMASDEKDWNISLAESVRLWKGGCIIRARLLNQIQAAFTMNPDLANLLLDPSIALEINSCITSWRNIIITCANSGIPVPSLGGSLSYYDSYRCSSLPANLTQAMRDYFGGHTYKRIDRDGVFHTSWTDSHKDIGNISERTKGEL